MEKFYLIAFFIFGSVMGSFYHVLATRVSKGLSIVYPASHCEICNHNLK
ncbi:prepilin peptidase, partial [Salmonella enterica]